jgi:hypothetical protein
VLRGTAARYFEEGGHNEHFRVFLLCPQVVASHWVIGTVEGVLRYIHTLQNRPQALRGCGGFSYKILVKVAKWGGGEMELAMGNDKGVQGGPVGSPYTPGHLLGRVVLQVQDKQMPCQNMHSCAIPLSSKHKRTKHE